MPVHAVLPQVVDALLMVFGMLLDIGPPYHMTIVADRI
jgi:hypothetical protein